MAQATNERVVHLWVDPLYGNDGFAAAFNPNAVPPGNPVNHCSSTDRTPVDVIDPVSGGMLLHVPHPFQTINAALAYIDALSPGGGVPPLPFTASTGLVWRHAIIHLLPGYYHGGNPAMGDGSIDNGLPSNKEVFPLHLPPSVSIQGTSALNTVLDIREGGPAFEFGLFWDPTTRAVVPADDCDDDCDAIPLSGEHCFIDSVTILGGSLTSDPSQAASFAQLGGIVLHPETPAHPTISNCVFTRNRVGVIVSSSESDESIRHHGTLLINNTFVWNRIGLWNGEHTNFVDSRGESRILVINNIFDGTFPVGTTPLPCFPTSSSTFSYWPHQWAGFAGASGFEGVCSEDMSVLVGGSGGTPTNFNAFETEQGLGSCRFFNSGQPILTLLPPTTLRSMTTQPMPDPVLDIGRLTAASGNTACSSNSGGQRGILYIRDLLCHGKLDGSFPQLSDWDGSPLDFRLSPSVATFAPTSDALPRFPSMANPLIDAGFSGPFPAVMQNLEVVANRPGALPIAIPGQIVWPFDPWTTDMEGFGNPRQVDDPFSPDGISAVDIGADEVGALIVAGYRYGTTSFLKGLSPNVNGSNVLDNRDLAYIGPANTTLTPSQEQPWYRSVVGFDPANWPWTATLTGLESWHGDWRFGNPSAGTSLIYQASAADTTPHLLPDAHPWWITSGLPTPSLTVWQHCWSSYNEFLYLDPSAPIVNPQGTYQGFVGQADPVAPGGPLVDFEYLDGSASPTGPPASLLFARYNHWLTAPPVAFTAPPLVDFGPFCRGGTAAGMRLFPLASTQLSMTRTEALRFSLEFSTEDDGALSARTKNIQSFLVWIDEDDNQ